MEHGTGAEQPQEMGEHRISFRGCLPIDGCFLFRRGVLGGVTEKVVKLDCQREPCPVIQKRRTGDGRFLLMSVEKTMGWRAPAHREKGEIDLTTCVGNGA